ncbi:MAG: hypothetical protein MZV70_03605 [Desulfobacterales bacterium]|nr:hypothetical protein [Desulfobacterales bacterium]
MLRGELQHPPDHVFRAGRPAHGHRRDLLRALLRAAAPAPRRSIPLSFLAATFALGAAGLLPVYLAELAITGPFALSREIALSILYVAHLPVHRRPISAGTRGWTWWAPTAPGSSST